VEILAQSSAAFTLTYNFQGSRILGASRGHLSDSVIFLFLLLPLGEIKMCIFKNSSQLAPPVYKGTSANRPTHTNLIFLETRIIGLHLAAESSMVLFSFKNFWLAP